MFQAETWTEKYFLNNIKKMLQNSFPLSYNGTLFTWDKW